MYFYFVYFLDYKIYFLVKPAYLLYPLRILMLNHIILATSLVNTDFCFSSWKGDLMFSRSWRFLTGFGAFFVDFEYFSSYLFCDWYFTMDFDVFEIDIIHWLMSSQNNNLEPLGILLCNFPNSFISDGIMSSLLVWTKTWLV